MDALEYVPSAARARASSIAGSISFACWLVLIFPQLVEMWRCKSVDGISPLFLIFWTVGDIANVIGAIWGHLLPEVILTGIWFFFADVCTLCCYYYIKTVFPEHRKLVHARRRSREVSNSSETSALIDSDPLDTPNATGGAGAANAAALKRHRSHRRHSSTVESVLMEPAAHTVFVRYAVPLLFVIGAGVIGSFCSPNGSSHEVPKNDDPSALGPEICGYISAVMYLTARLPQIVHNHRQKSCKGLSLLFFMLSTLANATYGLQIILFNDSKEYLKLNAPWLLGSLGTIFEDAIIFAQFYIYGQSDSDESQHDELEALRDEPAVASQV